MGITDAAADRLGSTADRAEAVSAQLEELEQSLRRAQELVDDIGGREAGRLLEALEQADASLVSARESTARFSAIARDYGYSITDAIVDAIPLRTPTELGWKPPTNLESPEIHRERGSAGNDTAGGRRHVASSHPSPLSDAERRARRAAHRRTNAGGGEDEAPSTPQPAVPPQTRSNLAKRGIQSAQATYDWCKQQGDLGKKLYECGIKGAVDGGRTFKNGAKKVGYGVGLAETHVGLPLAVPIILAGTAQAGYGLGKAIKGGLQAIGKDGWVQIYRDSRSYVVVELPAGEWTWKSVKDDDAKS